jgi:magnesium-transporting ATPase (P-type)
MSNWHSMEIDEVIKELGADPNKGLSSEEASRRAARYGRNELREGNSVSAYPIFDRLMKDNATKVFSPVIAADRMKRLVHSLIFGWKKAGSSGVQGDGFRTLKQPKKIATPQF